MTYYVGIDIAKYKHDCFIADDSGCVIRDSFSFQNDKDGFNVLLSILKELKPKGQTKIGFESTGHYHFNLKLFLEDNGFDYAEINPLLIHNFAKEKTLRRTKTDKVDSRIIAEYIMNKRYKSHANSFYHINNLKSLCRLRETLITNRTKYINLLLTYIDQIFPEFMQFFKDGLNKSAFYLLTHYLTPAKMSKLNADKYSKMKSELKSPISYQKICQIKDAASKSIGHSSEGLERSLKITLDMIMHLNKQIEKSELQIKEIYNSMHCHIHTIKGIGLISAAGILSEIGNFERFTKPSQIQAYAGIEPSKNDSGTHNGTGVMVKHGSSYLRKYLMNVASTFYAHNPAISDYYWKKRNEGKVHRVALSHVARKLINTIFALEKNDIDFNPNLLK